MGTTKLKQARSKDFKKYLAEMRKQWPELQFNSIKHYFVFRKTFYDGWDLGHKRGSLNE